MNRPIVIGVIGALIVAGAIALNYILTRPGEEEAPPVETAGKPPAEAGAPASAEPEAAEERETPDLAAPPSFDIVRVNPKGDAVIAGRAEPGAEVTIYDRGEEIGKVTADPRGEWVLVPSERLPPGSRELSLSAKKPGEESVESESSVVLVVPEPGKDIAGRETGETSTPLALQVPRKGEGAPKVLQAPPPAGTGPAVGEEEMKLTLEIIDYGAEGEVTLSGNAPPDSRLQVYLDNELLGTTHAGKDGGWTLTPARKVPPGNYNLRIDQVGSGGKVVARLEIPFSRADPLLDLAGERFVVIQPGDYLWRIARHTYGRGIRYTHIYQANRDQIRDPDLIYPGQIFVLPPID